MAPSRPAEELYDIQADPWEIVNLIDDPKHQATKVRLRNALENWIEQTHDMGRVPEPQEIIDYWNNTAQRTTKRLQKQKQKQKQR